MGKLSEEQKQEARKLIASGITRKDVATKFGVSPQSISRATEGIEKPEMRGRHNVKKKRRIYFREDYEW